MRFAFVTPDVRPTTLRALNYSPYVEAFRKRRSSLKHAPLGELVADFGGGYGTIFKGFDCNSRYGIELLSQKDLFATRPSGRFIRRDSIASPDTHRVRRWQVLIAGTGTLGESELYGRAAIADQRLDGKYCGPDIFALTFKSEGGPKNLYAYAFLCTAIGLQAVRSTSYGTKLLRQRQDMLSALPIPLATDSIQQTVAGLIEDAVGGRDRFHRHMAMARGELEALPEMKAALPLCVERKARAVNWTGELRTLTAWAYASTGGALEHLSGTWRRCLKDVLSSDGLYDGPRFARIPCQAPHGISLLSQRDVFMMRPVGRRIVHPGLPDRLLFAPPHALLVASDGQLTEGSLFGRVELAAAGLTQVAITEHILRIIPHESVSPLAYAYFSTVVGMRMLQSTAIGTSVPTMRLDLMASLPFPVVSDSVANAVAKHVKEAVAARNSAAAAEAQAIRLVEEEVLPAWLA